MFAAAGAFLTVFFLDGPILGRTFDFFLKYRPPLTVSREVLIIDTDEFIESSDIFSILMTMAEMNASNLIMTAKISGSSSPVSGSEAEIRLRFADEYNILSENIRNLFEAIRSGSVLPSQAPHYVNSLVELTEKSRDRLLSGLIESDEDLARSVAVFGNYTEAAERPLFDHDGKLRRVQPIDKESSIEHPVYGVIKRRYALSQIINTSEGQMLLQRAHDGKEMEINLDKNGNIIAAGVSGGFRRISQLDFRKYDDAGFAMRRALKEAGDLGALYTTLPEYSPLFLDEYAAALREELLKEPDGEKLAAYMAARSEFFKSLKDFLYGQAEATLVKGYEEVIADETSLNEEGIAKLAQMRKELISSFASMREKYEELFSLYNMLSDSLAFSFCVLGPRDNTQYSALLANVLITGSHVRPAFFRYAFYWSIATAVILLLIIFRMRPALVLTVGFSSGLLAAVVFGCNFVITAYWIDPAIVFISTLSGSLFIFFCKFASIRRRARRFKIAYGMVVPGDVLNALILRGKPDVHERTIANAAIVAIRDFNLLSREDREKPQDAGNVLKLFYEDVKREAFSNGAVIAGFQGDTIVVCFGSPLNSAQEPVLKACSFIKNLLNNEKISWRFGMDTGECAFSWSAESGFLASGSPVVRAKIFASKAARFNVRAIVSASVWEKIDSASGVGTGAPRIPTGSLNSGKIYFYEFP